MTVVAEGPGVTDVPGDSVAEGRAVGVVLARGDGEAVRVAAGSGFEERIVKVGMRGVALLEITEGLSEGDKVLLLDGAGNGEGTPAR